MKDKRGVLRGRCLKCECEEYDQPDQGNAYSYCRFTQVDHQEVPMANSQQTQTADKGQKFYEVYALI